MVRHLSLIRFAILLVFLVSGAAAQQATQEWEKAMTAGMRAYRTQDFREAEKKFKQALKLAEAIGPEGYQVASTVANLGMTSKALQDLDKAESLLKRAVVLFEKNLGPDHPDLAFVMNQLGLVYYQRVPGTRANTSGGRTYSFISVVPGVVPDSPALNEQRTTSSVQTEIDQIRRRATAQNFPPAERCFQRVLAIVEKNAGADSPRLVPTLESLGDLYFATGHFAEADSSFRRALSIVENDKASEKVKASGLLLNLALSAWRQEKPAEAEPLLSRALAIQTQTLGPEHPDLIPTLETYAALLKELDRKDEAKQLEQRANAIRRLKPKK